MTYVAVDYQDPARATDVVRDGASRARLMVIGPATYADLVGELGGNPERGPRVAVGAGDPCRQADRPPAALGRRGGVLCATGLDGNAAAPLSGSLSRGTSTSEGGEIDAAPRSATDRRGPMAAVQRQKSYARESSRALLERARAAPPSSRTCPQAWKAMSSVRLRPRRLT
jgi:hypothetical protein